jgi:hypothetical protein
VQKRRFIDPALPGVLLTPAIALLAFAYLRGGALLRSRHAEFRPTTGFAVVAGVVYLQEALVALDLGVAVSPFVGVAPAVIVIRTTTSVERTGVTGRA